MTPCKKGSSAGDVPRLFVDQGLLKSMVETAVNAVLQQEVERHLGAGLFIL